MSELINNRYVRADFQVQLLATASAIALTTYLASTTLSKAEDSDRPTVWIELGGQMEATQGTSAPFVAPFMTAISPTPAPYANDIFNRSQRPAHLAFGLSGSVTVQPENSDWMFSVNLRYGRSSTNRHEHHQSVDAMKTLVSNGVLYTHKFPAAPFADAKGAYDESHLVLDFMAGRDVGLGAFGQDGSSSISAGVRLVQFSTKSNFSAIGRPSIQFAQHGAWYGEVTFFNYTAAANTSRSFSGAGPSLSWKGSAALVGNKDAGEISLDWAIDGAVLFGRQKATVSHTTQAYQLPENAGYFWYQGYYYTRTYRNSQSHARSHSVVVPNLGGFAGLSVKYPNAKVSIGYRADFFFGAVDTGIDERHSKTLSFNGPFASISIGLGG